jgi:hypothetical protein
MTNNKPTQLVDFSNPNADNVISDSTQSLMSLDLNKLENKLDEALIKETTETLTKFLNDKRMKNKQTINKLYTEEEIVGFLKLHYAETICAETFIKNLTPIHPLPSEEEKLDVAYGNGYEQGEMDFYKKMRGEGNKYADGYAEGYQRALELVKYRIVEQLEARQ